MDFQALFLARILVLALAALFNEDFNYIIMGIRI